jgi:hypothetical protein
MPAGAGCSLASHPAAPISKTLCGDGGVYVRVDAHWIDKVLKQA